MTQITKRDDIKKVALTPSVRQLAQTEQQTTAIFGLSSVNSFSPEWVIGSESDLFDLTGWIAEEELPPPEGDPTLSKVALEIQSEISKYAPRDSSSDWQCADDLLPERASPRPKAHDSEAGERLRKALLRAIREGSVPSALIEDLSRGDDGETDSEAFAILNMVINDLGAETDERFEYWAPYENFEVFVSPVESPDEEELLNATMSFCDELADRRNEPLRIFMREFRGKALLNAEAEVALGQTMERSVEKALDALAAWPMGIEAVLNAAKKVTTGLKTLRWLSSGPADKPYIAEASLGDEKDLEEENEGETHFDNDTNESISELEGFRAKAAHLSNLNFVTNQESAGWKTCREAIASLGLTRSFLLNLADPKIAEEPVPTVEFGQAISTYRYARDQMVVANLKLVYSISRKYLFSGQPLDDLLQEGNIGLIKAVDRYDWRRGLRFSTYATWWIRQQVGRYVAEKGKTIRLPIHVYEMTQRIAQSTSILEDQHRKKPNNAEIAEMMGLSVKKVSALIQATLEPLSVNDIDLLDEHIAADSKDDYTARDPMDIVEDKQLIGSIARYLETINPKEARVLRMRFGIGIQESMTLDDIGKRLNLTRERIRQVETTALRKLRNPARLEKLVRELYGQALQNGKNDLGTNGISDEDEGEAIEVMGGPAAKRKKVHAFPKPKQPNVPVPTELEKLLNQAKAIGIAVEYCHDGLSQKIWVHITDTPNNQYRKIVRKLFTLGFSYWPSKGYWR